jgi:hypothetical protein
MVCALAQLKSSSQLAYRPGVLVQLKVLVVRVKAEETAENPPPPEL